ncbi:hypothetical protein ACLB1Q_00580 [Escherichia coli]
MLVRVQLLGQFPQWLAENAARAVELGSWRGSQSRLPVENGQR